MEVSGHYNASTVEQTIQLVMHFHLGSKFVNEHFNLPEHNLAKEVLREEKIGLRRSSEGDRNLRSSHKRSKKAKKFGYPKMPPMWNQNYFRRISIFFAARRCRGNRLFSVSGTILEPPFWHLQKIRERVWSLSKSCSL